jgi:hypothetical protein
MNDFISGATFMAYLIAGLFFLRFWKESHDRLFAIFALSFWILATNRMAFIYFKEVNETHTALYGVRLIAFMLILIAIIDKNRGGKN